MTNFKLIIITGLSGAGKSEAIKIFEDLDYFCIDNLPVMLIEKFIEICSQTKKTINKLALVIDIREREFLENFYNVLENFEHVGFHYDLIFFEATNEAIIRRYSATRRKHPLGEEDTICENINKEKKILAGMRKRATLIVDTSNYNLNDLKNLIINKFIEIEKSNRLVIRLCAFGFKYGLPIDSDLVFDVRFLPNPYYVEKLKKYTGKVQEVKDFVNSNSVTQEFMPKFYALIDFLIPKYICENKAYLTIAIGCTGGKHRSVIVADDLFEHFQKQNYMVKVIYRDIDKE